MTITNYYPAIEKDLQQIGEMLLLNGTLTEDPGLVHGKMGIAVFLFHYAQYTENMLFADYAMDLIGEMQNQLHANSCADYEKGVAGIGVGIGYLIQNDYLDAEDDIFEDLDQRMYRAVMYDPWQDFSLYEGLTGYGRYWISRLRRQSLSVQAQECLLSIAEQIEKKFQDIPQKEQTDVYCFLHDLHEISSFDFPVGLLERYQKLPVRICWSFPRLCGSSNILRMHQCRKHFNDALQEDIDMVLKQIPKLDMEKPPVSMGLLTGYAGEGMLRLTALGSANQSWMNLL